MNSSGRNYPKRVQVSSGVVKQHIVKEHNKVILAGREEKIHRTRSPLTSGQLQKEWKWLLGHVGLSRRSRVSGSEDSIKPKERRERHRPRQQALPDCRLCYEGPQLWKLKLRPQRM